MTEDFDLYIFTRMRGNALAPEDLILLKQQSWREKDKLDVAALQEILAA